MKKSKVKTNGFWLDLWKLLSPSKIDFKKIFILTIIYELVALLGPYFLKLIIDRVITFNPEEVGIIIILIAAMFVSEQAKSGINYFKEKIIFRMLLAIEYYLPVRAQEKLVNLSLSYHEKENTGNKIVKIEKGVNKIVDFMANLSWEVIPTILQLIITLLVLFIIEWRFGVAMLFFAPLFIWITFWVNEKVNPVRKKRYKDQEVASGRMVQSIINVNTVKSFVQEKTEVRGFAKIREIIRVNETREWNYVLKIGLGRNLIIDLGRSTTLLLGVYLALHNQISVGMLIFVITLSEKAYFSLFRLSRFYDKIEEGKEAVRRFMTLLDAKNPIKNPKNGFVPTKIIGKVEFRNVNFSYNEDKIKALDKIDLLINSGCVTAFVGPSGGGKTTLARMIYRHYDPISGGVFLDGKDLREYDLYEFRKFMSIVPQEVEVFDLTVGENIAYAKVGASFKEIKAAAKMANADEFISKLPQGYDTKVGERGIKLSGGQRQRLGIARALLVNPRILIFDEATSSLDSQSERLIQEAMERISRGRTTIIIAHRLSTIKKADKIVVIEDGKIAEEGNHMELSKNRGSVYAKLLKLQKVGEVN